MAVALGVVVGTAARYAVAAQIAEIVGTVALGVDEINQSLYAGFGPDDPIRFVPPGGGPYKPISGRAAHGIPLHESHG